MTQGPPSTAASSSKTPSGTTIPTTTTTTGGSSNGPGSGASHPHTSPPPAPAPEPAFVAWNAVQYAAHYPAHAYYAMPSPMAHYPTPIGANPYAGHLARPQPSAKGLATAPPVKAPKKTRPAGARESTPPPPEPETYAHWDEVVKTFLVRAGLVQAARGLEHDMLVLNAGWEQEVIPSALAEMVRGLQVILDRVAGKKKAAAAEDVMDTSPDIDTSATDPGLDERKLAYIPSTNGTTPQSHSSINKSIAQFLARTRARNDASNRAEFLLSLAEKRRRLHEAGVGPGELALAASCARVDAKSVDRDKQMQFDIAKNGEGPLIKTVKHASASASTSGGSGSGNGNGNGRFQPVATETAPLEKKRKLAEFENDGDSKARRRSKGKGKEVVRDPSPSAGIGEDEAAFEARITAEDKPALDERLRNIEEHFAVRYVPSIPRTLFARLKYLEDHIIKLEKEYPPWAALHFNQPSRGWPAPPRATPIIVPPHLRSTAAGTGSAAQPSISSASTGTAPAPSAPGQPSAATPAGVPAKSRKANSSLHRAVLDRLEVQRAMEEMNSMRQGS